MEQHPCQSRFNILARASDVEMILMMEAGAPTAQLPAFQLCTDLITYEALSNGLSTVIRVHQYQSGPPSDLPASDGKMLRRRIGRTTHATFSSPCELEAAPDSCPEKSAVFFCMGPPICY